VDNKRSKMKHEHSQAHIFDALAESEWGCAQKVIKENLGGATQIDAHPKQKNSHQRDPDVQQLLLLDKPADPSKQIM